MIRYMWWLCVVTLSAPTLTVAYERPYVRSYYSSNVDFDGDGQDDLLRVRLCFAKDGLDSCSVQIGQGMALYLGHSIVDTFEVVDIDTADGRKEVAIYEDGPSDDYRTSFFAYDGDEAFRVGTVEDFPRPDGSGIIRTLARGYVVHTWFHPMWYYLNKAHRLKAVTRDLYPMGGTPVVTKQPLVLWRSRRCEGRSFRVGSGERVFLQASNDYDLVLIRTFDGQYGWVTIKHIEPSNEWFEGLDFSD